MPKYHHAASVIFINGRGEFVMQRRDNKPNIRNPGMITAWGGALEYGETALQAAVREVSEETNLKPQEDDFVFFGDYIRNHRVNGARVLNHVFILGGVDEKNLEVFEGQGYAIVNPTADTTSALYTDLTKELIRDYSLRSRTLKPTRP